MQAKGRSPEEIHDMYLLGVSPRYSSDFESPEVEQAVIVEKLRLRLVLWERALK
jgi:hypothetical protein